MVKYYGVRGVVLSLFGISWLAYGFSVISKPSEKFSRPGPGGPMEFLDHSWWGYFWIAAGIFAIIAMFLRRRSTRHDELAYGFLAAPAGLWTAGYAMSALMYAFSGGEFGQERAVIGFIIFANFLVMILLLSRHLHDVEVDTG